VLLLRRWEAMEPRVRIAIVMKSSNRRIVGRPTACTVKPDGTWLTLEDCETKNPSSGLRTQTIRLESCKSVAFEEVGGDGE
jgi:hypothetical protein